MKIRLDEDFEELDDREKFQHRHKKKNNPKRLIDVKEKEGDDESKPDGKALVERRRPHSEGAVP